MQYNEVPLSTFGRSSPWKLSFAVLSLLASSLVAQAGTIHEWDGPREMSKECGDAVVAKLMSSRDDEGYITRRSSVSLEWYDRAKSAVSFTVKFNPDEIRDGYLDGEVAVKVARDGSCEVGKILRSSIGD
jgi:hypothetical protein